MFQNKYRTTLFLLFLLFFAFSPGFAQSKKPVTIGVIIDGHWDRNQQIIEIFKKEITDLLVDEYHVNFSKENIITGDWTAQSVKSGLNKLLKDPKIHLIIAMGTLVVSEVQLHPNLEKPVIISFVIDAELQGLTRKGQGSGTKNLNYLVSVPPWKKA